MNETLPSDELDLLQLIETIWGGKWKIIAITAACVLGVFGFQVLGPAPSFVATTEIKPILAGDAEDYRQSNMFGFFLPSIVTFRQKTSQSYSPHTATGTMSVRRTFIYQNAGYAVRRFPGSFF